MSISSKLSNLRRELVNEYNIAEKHQLVFEEIAKEIKNKSFDYSKVTLCPQEDYETYCCVAGKCEHCSHYFLNGDDCKGCGANFENKEKNTKCKYDKQQNDQ